MIEIDGSRLSGSGTIVRDAASLCILCKERLRITNIRAKRPKPGLRPQHLKALEAAAQLCGGELTGAFAGSKEITLAPGSVLNGGAYEWNIGSAGSAVMLALTILPLALFADGPSRYRITGGLFQDFAPSAFHFLHVLLPALRKMGLDLSAVIVRPGYVPKGQGVLEIRAAPAKRNQTPLDLADPGAVTRIDGIALSSHLSEKKVSKRMAEACRTVLATRGYAPRIDVLYDDKDTPVYRLGAVQPGAALAIWAETDTGCRIGSDMAGARGRSSEFIGRQTAACLLEDLDARASVDRHLADQLIPFTALIEGESVFRIPAVTEHVEVRLWLVEKILGAKTAVEAGIVRIQGRRPR